MLPVALLFDAADVLHSGPMLMAFAGLVVLPVGLALTFGVLLKSASDFLALRKLGVVSWAASLDVLYRHVAVLTPRGWTLLGTGTLFVAVAVGAKFAEFGVFAVLTLLTAWFSLGFTVLASTGLVGWFRKRAAVERHFEPSVAQTGDDVRDVVVFRDVPVPWGYTLLFEDDLPARLATRTRWALATTVRDGEVRCDGSLRVVPRGVWNAGPARISYQDLLGLTRVSVASVATAALKVLPRVVPVWVIALPKVQRKRPDVLSRLHRFPTDDPFRLREYAPGDDVRRIHWKRSLREGRLHVRIPETREREVREVLIVLDNSSPGAAPTDTDGASDLLDSAVVAFVGIANALLDAGDRVTVAAVIDGRVSVQPLKRTRIGEAQDIGARVTWQSTHGVADLLAAAGVATEAVVVTARWSAAPLGDLPGRSITWVWLDPAEVLGPSVPPPWTIPFRSGVRAGLWSLIARPTAAGSEDDSRWRRWLLAWQKHQLHVARQHLRTLASRRAALSLVELAARGESVYRLEVRPRGLVLRGAS